MFIGTGTNNDLRKLRQERHGTSSAAQSDMPLLTELGSRAGHLSYKHAAPTELSPTGRPLPNLVLVLLRQNFMLHSSAVHAK